jgi:hypothetical protein
MLKTLDKIFKNSDDKELTVVTITFPATKAIEITNKLCEIVISLTGIVDCLDNNKLDIVSKVLKENFNSDGIIKLILSLLSFTKVDGVEVKDSKVLDVLFSSNDFVLLFEILQWVLEVNFKDFFGERGIGKLILKGKELMAEVK